MLSGALISPGPPTNDWAVNFDQDMDQTVTPTPANFSAMIDAAPQVVSNFSWLTPQAIRFDTTGNAPVTSATFRLDTTDANLRSLALDVALAPQIVDMTF